MSTPVQLCERHRTAFIRFCAGCALEEDDAYRRGERLRAEEEA